MKFDLKNERHLFFLFGLIALSYYSYALVVWIEHFFNYEVVSVLHKFHAFTIPVFFYGYASLFNKYAWKWPIWRNIGVIDFPDLNGVYKGKFTSSYLDANGNKTEGDMELVISQTASNISIEGKFNQSISISIQAFFAVHDFRNEVALYYFYKNQPANNATASMHAHEGSAVLFFDPKNKTLSGEYYSGRDRNNHGDIIATKL